MSLVSKLMQVVTQKNQELSFNLKVSLKGQYATVYAIDQDSIFFNRSGKVASILSGIDSLIEEAQKLAPEKSILNTIAQAISEGKTVVISDTYTVLRVNEKTLTVQNNHTNKKKYLKMDFINNLTSNDLNILYQEAV